MRTVPKAIPVGQSSVEIRQSVMAGAARPGFSDGIVCKSLKAFVQTLSAAAMYAVHIRCESPLLIRLE